MFQTGTQFHYDVIVIGSGIAGLAYVLQLSQSRPDCRIALITKRTLDISSSVYAQGGLAAAQDLSKSVMSHIEDTLKAGGELCERKTVNTIIQSGQQVIHFLNSYGITFDTQPDGSFDLTQEGGHTERRIYHIGDETGKALIYPLIQAIKKLKNVFIFENHTAINLIHTRQEHNLAFKNKILGIYVLENKNGLIHVFLAQITVLATGGAGKVYRYTTNPDTATGDGIAMAYRAGARISNMEFYQFHPTLLYDPGQHNFLISEALRGEGAYLISPRTEERFMQSYSPQQMELATRDVVARAIFKEIENNEINYVYLDTRHLSREFLKQRFPHIFETLLTVGIDIKKDRIPIVPGAHYLCGGILTDSSGRTDLGGLYALGETACTGLHGANRLASNSLLEGVAVACKAAEFSAEELHSLQAPFPSVKPWTSPSLINYRRASQINAHWRGLRGEMHSYAGIIRTEAGLKDLLRLIKVRKSIIEEYYWQHSITPDLIELRNIILVAELIAYSALKRKESRGGHYREDYPHPLPYGEETILRIGLN